MVWECLAEDFFSAKGKRLTFTGSQYYTMKKRDELTKQGYTRTLKCHKHPDGSVTYTVLMPEK